MNDILSDTIETLELTIRAARRCAYDLNHCANNLTGEDSTLFLERAQSYIKLFQSGNACKDYRHRLHLTICELENKIETLRSVLKTNNIGDPTEVF